MPDETGEEVLSCQKARAEIPWNPARSTISDYLHIGVRNIHTGKQVYLEYDQNGGRPVIKRRYITEFIAAINSREKEIPDVE